MLIKDILSDDLFISHEESYYKFNENWNTYHREGYLPQILQELKDRSYPIPLVWNIWTKREEEWELDVRKEEDKYSCSYPRVQVYGDPGSVPTEEQKAQVEIEMLKAQDAQAKHWAEYKAKKEQDTNTIHSSILGATVIEFVPPDDNEDYGESGYLILQAPNGVKIKVTSTHSTWNYGEDSSDSLYITLVSEEDEEVS